MSRNVVDIFSIPLCIETQIYDLSKEELDYLKSLDTRETPNNKISQDIFVGNNNKLSKLMKIIDYYVENYKSEVLQIDNEIDETSSLANFFQDMQQIVEDKEIKVNNNNNNNNSGFTLFEDALEFDN